MIPKSVERSISSGLPSRNHNDLTNNNDHNIIATKKINIINKIMPSNTAAGPIRLLTLLIQDMKAEFRRSSDNRRRRRQQQKARSFSDELNSCGDLLDTSGTHHITMEHDLSELHRNDQLQALFHSEILDPAMCEASVDDELSCDDYYDEYSIDDLYDGFAGESTDDDDDSSTGGRNEKLPPIISQLPAGALRLRLLSAASSLDAESDGEYAVSNAAEEGWVDYLNGSFDDGLDNMYAEAE